MIIYLCKYLNLYPCYFSTDYNGMIAQLEGNQGYICLVCNKTASTKVTVINNKEKIIPRSYV